MNYPLYCLGLEVMNAENRVEFILYTYLLESIGNVIVGGLAYLIRDWQTLQLVVFIPMILLISYFL